MQILEIPAQRKRKPPNLVPPKILKLETNFNWYVLVSSVPIDLTKNILPRPL